MIESRRQAYLEVMGFDVWSLRPPEPEADRLQFKQGEGDTLLVCNLADVEANPFAGDIARALGDAVVWARPDPEGSPESPTLEDAIGQQLFTTVVIFGAGLAQQMFKGEVPLVVGSAKILVTHPIEDLAVRGKAKSVFWNQLSGLCID